MKRNGKLFEQITSTENLSIAYQKARRGKSRKSAVKRFALNPEARIERIRASLVERSFHTSEYETKWVYEPKPRQIFVLPFNPDRIVQHAIMNVIEPIWDAMFISDSYACRRGKGQHAGSRRVMEFVRRHRYCLKCDISRFYPSVDHDVLYEIIQRKIKCSGTLWLLKDIIYSMPGGTNVPIGNYTSQWFGNLYLNELDQYLKHEWRIKAYARYCDDFVLFHDSKAFLNEAACAIGEFIRNRLRLKFSRCDLFPVSQGVDFLGYRHFPRYILVRRSTAARVKRRLNVLPALLERGRITIESYRGSVMSTLGWLKWANSYNLQLAVRARELADVCS